MEKFMNKLVAELAHLGWEASKAAVAVACAWVFAFAPAYKEALETSYAKGVEEGRKGLDYKALALKDKPFTNALCNAWWFEADHKSRRLTPN